MKIQMKKVFNLKTGGHHYESKFSLTKSDNDVQVILVIKDLRLCTTATIRNILKDEDLPEYWVRLAYPEEVIYGEIIEQFSLKLNVFKGVVFSTEHEKDLSVKLKHLYNNKKEYYLSVVGTPHVLRVYQINFSPNKNTRHTYWQNELMYNVITQFNIERFTHSDLPSDIYDVISTDDYKKEIPKGNLFKNIGAKV